MTIKDWLLLALWLTVVSVISAGIILGGVK